MNSSILFDLTPRGWRLSTSQLLPVSRDVAFAFFSDAANLQRITPPWLNFRILTPSPILMRRGALIDYRLRLRGVPLTWRTEITGWDPPHRFVDTQLRGPYRRWVHTHTFTPHPAGTLMHDEVDYAVPGGRLVNALFVQPDLRRIFEFRRTMLEAIFASPAPVTQAAQQ